MALSNSYDFTITRDDLITDALRELGAIDITESPSTGEITFAARKLNVLVKALQKDRIFIHCLDEETFNTSSGSSTYTSSAGTNRILSAWVRINNEDTPIFVKPIEAWADVQNKATQGIPTEMFVDPQHSDNGIILYPVPNAIYTIYYRRERMLMDFDTSTDNPDFPIKGARLLTKGLAVDLAPAYRVGLEERMVLKQEYEQEKKEYLAGNAQRTGREIVVPAMVV